VTYLRGSVESSEYKHLVLGLVFLKYVSDGFEARRQALDGLTRDAGSEWFAADDQDRAEILEDRDAYEVVNVFWVPKEARWDALAFSGSSPKPILAMVDTSLPSVSGEIAARA